MAYLCNAAKNSNQNTHKLSGAIM